MNKKITISLLYCLVLISGSMYKLIADDDESTEIMELVSETTNYSANITRKKNATEEEKKTDKERTRIGIGEEVTITLISKKPSLLEPKDKIQWKVKKGEELLENKLERIEEKPESASFRISPYLTKEQIEKAKEVIIEVKTQQEIALPEPITFEVVFPQQLTAEHETLQGLVGGSPALDMGFPGDGSPRAAASAELIVSVHPLDVCYEGIWIIEKDEGFVGSTGSLAGPHNADSIWSVNNENRFGKHDNIGAEFTIAELNSIKGLDENNQPVYKHLYPNEFTWNCLFKTYKLSNINGISNISNIHQNFHINRIKNNQFYIRLKKFLIDLNKNDECSVERTTGGKHIFKP